MGCGASTASPPPGEMTEKQKIAAKLGKGDAISATVELHALPASHHLRLGITLKALTAFMRRINWDVNSGPGSSYVRDEDELGFVTKAIGEYDPDVPPLSGQPNHLSGHDWLAAVRAWLVRNKHTNLSVLEALKKESNQGVGKATAFYSHAMMPSMLGWNGTIARMKLACQTYPDHLSEESTYWWLDSVSLRQCELEQNWSLDLLMGAVEACDCVVAEVDQHLRYLSRTFCLFEMHCALAVKQPLLINTYLVADEVNSALHDKPIRWDKSESRDEEARKQIRMKVHDTCGAIKLERELTKAVKAGARDSYTVYGEKGRRTANSEVKNEHSKMKAVDRARVGLVRQMSRAKYDMVQTKIGNKTATRYAW